MGEVKIEVIDSTVAAVLRKRTRTERIEMVLDANRTARLLIASTLKSRHPDWTDSAIQREVARRMLYGAK